jgi:hypothetical protein
MGRRALLVAAGWLGAAVLAVLVGLGAISVIGNGLTSGSTPALSAADVDRQLREQTPTTSAPAPTGTEPAGTEPAGTEPTGTEPTESTEPTGTMPPAETEPTADSTRGGTVVARCVGTQAEIVAMSPAQGFAVHEKDQGPQDDAEGEFRGSADDRDRVKISVTCADGRPSVSARSEGGDG